MIGRFLHRGVDTPNCETTNPSSISRKILYVIPKKLSEATSREWASEHRKARKRSGAANLPRDQDG
jgi:hypothetical protein